MVTKAYKMEDDSENYHESHEEDEEFELEDESGLSQVHQEADADNADENDGDGSEEDDDVEESKHIEKPVETILQLHHLPERSTNLELTVFYSMLTGSNFIGCERRDMSFDVITNPQHF